MAAVMLSVFYLFAWMWIGNSQFSGICYQEFEPKRGSNRGRCAKPLGGKPVINGVFIRNQITCCRRRSAAGWGRANSCKPCSSLRGILLQWGDWSQCSQTCGWGKQRRIRYCSNSVCAGVKGKREVETRSCMWKTCCPVHGGWSDWSRWSNCSASCGDGLQYRTRNCNSPSRSCGGKPCRSLPKEVQRCRVKDCAHWSTWSLQSGCSVTCGKGFIVRSRTCKHLHPGESCVGASEDFVGCDAGSCKIDGNWCKWETWSSCTSSCSHIPGTRKRARSCSCPAPVDGGDECSGEDGEAESCSSSVQCPINGQWGSWSSWGGCTAERCSPKTGTQKRVRSCDSPAPKNDGICIGPDTEQRKCVFVEGCEVNGIYGKWSTWTECSATCGLCGSRTRLRKCFSPKRHDRDVIITGEEIVICDPVGAFETQQCHLGQCPDGTMPCGPTTVASTTIQDTTEKQTTRGLTTGNPTTTQSTTIRPSSTTQTTTNRKTTATVAMQNTQLTTNMKTSTTAKKAKSFNFTTRMPSAPINTTEAKVSISPPAKTTTLISSTIKYIQNKTVNAVTQVSDFSTSPKLTTSSPGNTTKGLLSTKMPHSRENSSTYEVATENVTTKPTNNPATPLSVTTIPLTLKTTGSSAAPVTNSTLLGVTRGETKKYPISTQSSTVNETHTSYISTPISSTAPQTFKITPITLESHNATQSVPQASHNSTQSQKSPTPTQTLPQKSQTATQTVTQKSYNLTQTVTQKSRNPTKSVTQKFHNPTPTATQKSFNLTPTATQKFHNPTPTATQKSHNLTPTATQKSHNLTQTILQASHHLTPTVPHKSHNNTHPVTTQASLTKRISEAALDKTSLSSLKSYSVGDAEDEDDLIETLNLVGGRESSTVVGDDLYPSLEDHDSTFYGPDEETYGEEIAGFDYENDYDDNGYYMTLESIPYDEHMDESPAVEEIDSDFLNSILSGNEVHVPDLGGPEETVPQPEPGHLPEDAAEGGNYYEHENDQDSLGYELNGHSIENGVQDNPSITDYWQEGGHEQIMKDLEEVILHPNSSDGESAPTNEMGGEGAWDGVQEGSLEYELNGHTLEEGDIDTFMNGLVDAENPMVPEGDYPYSGDFTYNKGESGDYGLITPEPEMDSDLVPGCGDLSRIRGEEERAKMGRCCEVLSTNINETDALEREDCLFMHFQYDLEASDLVQGRNVMGSGGRCSYWSKSMVNYKLLNTICCLRPQCRQWSRPPLRKQCMNCHAAGRCPACHMIILSG